MPLAMHNKTIGLISTTFLSETNFFITTPKSLQNASVQSSTRASEVRRYRVHAPRTALSSKTHRKGITHSLHVTTVKRHRLGTCATQSTSLGFVVPTLRLSEIRRFSKLVWRSSPFRSPCVMGGKQEAPIRESLEPEAQSRWSTTLTQFIQ